MMYIKYFFFTIALIIFKIWCWMPWVSIPSALTAAAFKLDKLPGFWAWVHTHDDNIYGSKWRAVNDKDFDAVPTTFMKRFKTAMWWLYRNPGYGFSSYVLGYPAVTPKHVKYGMDKFTAADGTKLFSYRTPKSWYGWKNYEIGGRHMIVFRFWK